MSGKPYNVLLSAPTIDVQGWDDQAKKWSTLGRRATVVSEFNPVTLKALYVTGIVIDTCKSVSILLGKENLISTTYYPAYIVFASCIELLGRCIRGNTTDRDNTLDLQTGFKWLAEPSAHGFQRIALDFILTSTVNYKYAIKDLVALRHFSAHGQAINKSNINDNDAENACSEEPSERLPEKFDYLLLGEMPPLVAQGMESYLSELRSNEDLCNQLALASIIPYRNRPVFDSVWGLQADEDEYPSSVRNTIQGQDWTYKFARPELTPV